MRNKKNIVQQLKGIIKEQNEKDPVDSVDDISPSDLGKINAQINSPKTFANAVLDFINKLQDKEQTDFTKNQRIKQAISNLQQLQEASEEDIETQKEYNKELEKEIELKNQLKEKIAQKVKERLEFMGTADEDTMKYLQEISREELVALEKQFVEMFDTLGVIRYNASEQLSKGASEISQRIHNFITIFRQALKGYPVVKENISSDTRKYMLDKKLDYDKVKAIEKQFTEVARVLKDLEKNGGDPLSPKATKAYNALVSVSYIFRQMLRDIDDDRISKEFETGTYESKSLTNNHSNPVNEAAKKKLVSLINNIALKEGISKKEATIKAIKALQENK